MPKIIAVYSAKGGVGKTTLAVNLAGVSAISRQRKTLLWDLDAQGAATFLLTDTPPKSDARNVFTRDIGPMELLVPTAWPQLDVLSADPSLRDVEHLLLDVAKPKRLRKILKGMAPDYEQIILDCPPGLNELSDQIFKAADMIVVPVTPSPLGMRTLTQIIDYLSESERTKARIMPVISMADGRKKLHRTFTTEHPEWPVIPYASLIEQMTVKRAPLEAITPHSLPAQVIRAIADHMDRLLAVAPIKAPNQKYRGRPRIPRLAR